MDSLIRRLQGVEQQLDEHSRWERAREPDLEIEPSMVVRQAQERVQ